MIFSISRQRDSKFSDDDSRLPVRYRRCSFVVSRSLLQSAVFAYFLWPLSAFAEINEVAPTIDYKATVESALNRLDATSLEDDWYFTMEVVEGDELRVIHSDPHRDKYLRRQLASVNGVAPHADRQEEFYEAEVERVDGLDPNSPGYSLMVDVETLQLLASGEGVAKFSFAPRVKALKDSIDQVQGLLHLNLETRRIDQIDIVNTAPLSPAFSVTIDTYRLTMQFRQQQGENLLSKLESHAAGKAGFVKSFESLVEISFSDYKRADQ